MIDKKIFEIIEELSGAKQVKLSDDLQENIGLDSLGMVTLLVELENALSITFDESDMNPFDLTTVQDVVNLAEKYAEVCDE